MITDVMIATTGRRGFFFASAFPADFCPVCVPVLIVPVVVAALVNVWEVNRSLCASSAGGKCQFRQLAGLNEERLSRCQHHVVMFAGSKCAVSLVVGIPDVQNCLLRYRADIIVSGIWVAQHVPVGIRGPVTLEVAQLDSNVAAAEEILLRFVKNGGQNKGVVVLRLNIGFPVYPARVLEVIIVSHEYVSLTRAECFARPDIHPGGFCLSCRRRYDD